MVWPNDYNWQRLNRYAENLKKENFPSRDFWEIIKERPLTEDTISSLERDGWIITKPRRFTKSGKRRNFYGRCDSRTRVIEVIKELEAWERDTTLMHEIWHAYSDTFLPGSLDDFSENKDGRRRNAITEWLARKSRTDSRLLARAIRFGKFEPHLYDKSSLEATGLSIAPTFRTFGNQKYLIINQMERQED